MSRYEEEEEFELSDEDLEDMTDTTDTTVTTDGIEIKVDARALDAIATAAARSICVSLSETVKKKVEERLAEILDDAWKVSVQTMAQTAIDAYLQVPRAKTNEWGESITGKSTTLSAMIPETVNKWLTERVNAEGKVDSYHNDKHTSRLQWMLKVLVTDQLAAETKKAAADVTEKARAIVSQHVGRFISEQMVPAIAVDQR